MAFYCYNKNEICNRAENCDGCEVWKYEKGGVEAREEIIDTYAPDTDMTFILREIYEENGDPISTEVIGFYYGKPSDELTKEFAGKLKANFI